jgi:hypothetical protein
MKTPPLRTLLPLLFALALVGTTKRAHALGPIGLEAGIAVGYGTNPQSNDVGNPLGVGLGARAGVVLFDSLYGGLKIMDYIGSSSTQSLAGTSVTEKVHALQYGLDVGYNLPIPVLTIRPQVGVGSIGFTGSVDNVSQTNSSLYIEPGVTALIGLGLFYVGADVNYMLIPSFPQGDGSSKFEGAVTIHGQIGVKL